MVVALRSRSPAPEGQEPRAGLYTVTLDPTSTTGPTLAARTVQMTGGSPLGIQLLSGVPGERWPAAARRLAVGVSPPAWGFPVRAQAHWRIWRELTQVARLSVAL